MERKDGFEVYLRHKFEDLLALDEEEAEEDDEEEQDEETLDEAIGES